MPKCLMAKKWKAYPWPDRSETIEVEDDEEIDVVGDSPANKQATSTWGPSSPTAGATAPESPPPHSPKGSTILYNGELFILIILL
jgi:scratch